MGFLSKLDKKHAKMYTSCDRSERACHTGMPGGYIFYIKTGADSACAFSQSGILYEAFG